MYGGYWLYVLHGPRAKSEAEAYAKGAKADTLKKIDQFDRKVEEGSAKAKGTLSSWFGGK